MAYESDALTTQPRAKINIGREKDVKKCNDDRKSSKPRRAQSGKEKVEPMELSAQKGTANDKYGSITDEDLSDASLDDHKQLKMDQSSPQVLKQIESMNAQPGELAFKVAYPCLYNIEELKDSVEVLETILSRYLKGLPNKHNNCWFNAVLQALCSLSKKFVLFDIERCLESQTEPYLLMCGKLIKAMDDRSQRSELLTRDARKVLATACKKKRCRICIQQTK